MHHKSTYLAIDAFVMSYIVLLFIVQNIEELPWCYNKRFFWKVLDVPGNEISIVIAFLKHYLVEWHIFHIRKSDADILL